MFFDWIQLIARKKEKRTSTPDYQHNVTKHRKYTDLERRHAERNFKSRFHASLYFISTIAVNTLKLLYKDERINREISDNNFSIDSNSKVNTLWL